MTAVERGKTIKGATGDWEVVVGMEVHAQVASRSKLFSGAATDFGGAPNTHVSLVDAALPGMLPVLNEECVAQAVRTGLGLKAEIKLKSRFDRKNYFYPDLPQGYQISQYEQPIVGTGVVRVDLDDGSTVDVGIERLHLEQDAGKLLHDQHATASFVDLNRAGVALMEIVSKPDIRSAKEAMAYVTKLRAILRYLGTCDGNMEEGSLRADVNVSVRRPGEPLLRQLWRSGRGSGGAFYGRHLCQCRLHPEKALLLRLAFQRRGGGCGRFRPGSVGGRQAGRARQRPACRA